MAPSVWSFTEAGGHPQNEDAFSVRPHPDDPATVVCVVADGQGGQRGGGPAAQLACQTMIETAVKLQPSQLARPVVWSGLCRAADEAVLADEAAGFATLVGLSVAPGSVAGASSGDSAALLLSGNEVIGLTRHQKKNPPVGSGTAIVVPFAIPLVAPWRLLVMTDGVWKYVGWPRVTDIARREQGAALIAALQQAARLPRTGKLQDDFTVVLLEQP
jgi:PPM family protein phosphatase